MEKLFKEIHKHIQSSKESNTQISIASVGWHLYHLMRVITGIDYVMKKSNPEDYQYKFNWSRFLILLTGYFPRGQAKAPKSTIPKEEVTKEQLLALLNTTKLAYKNMQSMEKNQFFDHPYFGLLNKNQAIRFVKVHTNHHLKIIRDILKQ